MLQRFALYILGIVLLVCGIVLNSKASLGVAAIATVPYSLSVILKISYGDATVMIYVLFIAVQIILNRGEGWMLTLLQLPFSFLFAGLMKIVEATTVVPGSLTGKVFLYAGAVILTGAGAYLSIRMRIVPNPADGIVGAISKASGLTLGMAKNFFDTFCVLTTAAVSLIFAGKLIGIGIGTIVTVFATGRAVALMDHLFGRKIESIVIKNGNK